jgi:hypothetical protein
MVLRWRVLALMNHPNCYGPLAGPGNSTLAARRAEGAGQEVSG